MMVSRVSESVSVNEGFGLAGVHVPPRVPERSPWRRVDVVNKARKLGRVGLEKAEIIQSGCTSCSGENTDFMSSYVLSHSDNIAIMSCIRERPAHTINNKSP